MARADDRNRLCGLQRASGPASFLGPWFDACPHGASLGGAGAQSARLASFLKAGAKRKGDTSHTRTNSGVKPDDLLKLAGSKGFGGLKRALKEKTAESRWFATTGQAPFGRAKAAYWKINLATSCRSDKLSGRGLFQPSGLACPRTYQV